MDATLDPALESHVIRVGRGEPLLLLHGLGHRKEGWDPVLPGLAARFDVAAVDLPGFGGAPKLDRPQTDESLTDWCEQLLDALGWETAHVAGNSLGGLIALRLGARGRARSVTAISPAGRARGWEQTWGRSVLKVLHKVAPVAGKVGPIKDTAIGRSAAMGLVFGKPAAMTPGYAHLSLEGIEIATAFRETMDGIEMDAESVGPIDAPVTIAWGTRDVLLWPWQGQRWHADLPGSRLVRLPGLGHTPMPDDPDQVVDVIVRTAAAASAEAPAA